MGTYPVASITEVVDVGIDPGELRVVAGGVAVPDVDVGIGEGLAGVDVEHANLKEHGNTGLAVYTPTTPSSVAWQPVPQRMRYIPVIFCLIKSPSSW